MLGHYEGTGAVLTMSGCVSPAGASEHAWHIAWHVLIKHIIAIQ
jgi:hypothetical protein